MVILEIYTKSKRYIVNSETGNLIYRGLYNSFNINNDVYIIKGVDGTYASEQKDKLKANPDIIQITLPVSNTVLIIDDKNE